MKEATPKECVVIMPKRPRSGTSPSTCQAALSPLLEKVASASGSTETDATVLTRRRTRQAFPMRPAVSAPVTMKGAIASGMAQTAISASHGAQPAPAPMSGVIASQVGQAGQDNVRRSLPKFTKKSKEASANILPHFSPKHHH